MNLTLEWWKYVLIVALIVVEWWTISFGIWKKFKSDHDNDELIVAGIVIGFVTLFFSLVGYLLGHYLLGFGLGLVLGILVSAIKSGVHFWDLGDEVGKWLLACILPFFILINDWLRLAGVVLILGGSLFVKMKYRKFRWYKSGKSGLALVSIIFGIAILEVVVAFIQGRGLYFAGTLGIILAFGLFYSRVKNIKFIQWTKIKKRKSIVN